MAPEADAVLLLVLRRAEFACALPTMVERAQLAVPPGDANMGICDLGWTAGAQVVAAWTGGAPALLVTVHCSRIESMGHMIPLDAGSRACSSKITLCDFSIPPQKEHCGLAVG